MRRSVIGELLKIREEINGSDITIAKQDDISEKIAVLNRKIDALQNMLNERRINKNADESPVKTRKRGEIIEIIKERKKINSYELALIMKISRTRANEYLKELERDSLLKSELADKKMYYKLAG